MSAFVVLAAYIAAINATAADVHSNIYRVYAAPDVAVLGVSAVLRFMRRWSQMVNSWAVSL